ncbi:MAG: hypothetical protein ACI87E_004403, partial [Mariniblastus sp.]
MALTQLEFQPPTSGMPPSVKDFLEQTAPLVEQHRTKIPGGFRGFVPSDYQAFYYAISHLFEQRLAFGLTFCEWGSGLGISTCLASMVGYEAFGIEIDEKLVEAAEAIAEDFELPVAYAAGSLLPDGADDLIDEAFGENDGEISMVIQPDNAYEQIGFELDEFDVVFSFPWPTDEELTAKIFDRFANVGSI